MRPANFSMANNASAASATDRRRSNDLLIFSVCSAMCEDAVAAGVDSWYYYVFNFGSIPPTETTRPKARIADQDRGQTQKKIETDIVVVVQFRGDKLACERIYWDHAAVLRQVGLLKP